jgi:hypothetical protein
MKPPDATSLTYAADRIWISLNGAVWTLRPSAGRVWMVLDKLGSLARIAPFQWVRDERTGNIGSSRPKGIILARIFKQKSWPTAVGRQVFCGGIRIGRPLDFTEDLSLEGSPSVSRFRGRSFAPSAHFAGNRSES